MLLNSFSRYHHVCLLGSPFSSEISHGDGRQRVEKPRLVLHVCFARRLPRLCRVFLREPFHMASHPSLPLARVPLHGQGGGSRASGQEEILYSPK